MGKVEKYRELAKELRERAQKLHLSDQRWEILAFASCLESLADEADESVFALLGHPLRFIMKRSRGRTGSP
jgi:hypothetical protein